METLLESVDDDREFASELLELFLAQTPDQIQQIRLALEKHDFVAIGRIIHAQKAPFPVFGLTQVAAAGQAVEAHVAGNIEINKASQLVSQYMETLMAELPLMHVALNSMAQS
ncbi:hypothetical protein GCM10027085_28430 [Spirosoma aerophilum]